MKKIMLSLLVLMLGVISAAANSHTYRAWDKNGNQVTVSVASPDSPVVIKNGEAIIPLKITPGYDVPGLMVTVDFIRNGKSATNGCGMSGIPQGGPGNWYIVLKNATMYWGSLVDGSYIIEIKEQPQY